MKMVVAGIEILIYKIDSDLIRDYNWSWANGYLRAWVDGKTQSLHRIIAERMEFHISDQIDHIDGNKLNNQRNNLRSATSSQNAINSKKPKNNTSGYKGVSWSKKSKKWRAQICFEGKQIHLGFFDDSKDAANAYDKAALKYFGEFARLNFPRRK